MKSVQRSYCRMCCVTCLRNDMDENLGVRQCSHLGTGCDVWRTECFPSTSITHFHTLLGAAGKICLQIHLARKMNQSKWGKGKEELISDKLQRGHSSAGNVFSIITYFCNLTGANEDTGHEGDGWRESDFILCTTSQIRGGKHISYRPWFFLKWSLPNYSVLHISLADLNVPRIFGSSPHLQFLCR